MEEKNQLMVSRFWSMDASHLQYPCFNISLEECWDHQSLYLRHFPHTKSWPVHPWQWIVNRQMRDDRPFSHHCASFVYLHGGRDDQTGKASGFAVMSSFQFPFWIV